MPEPGKIIRYRLGLEQTEHVYHCLYELVHEHDGEAHAHAGGSQFHYHYPDTPPGWEPAYLEG